MNGTVGTVRVPGHVRMHLASLKRQAAAGDEHAARYLREFSAALKGDGAFTHGGGTVLHTTPGCGGSRTVILGPVTPEQVEAGLARGARWCQRCGGGR